MKRRSMRSAFAWLVLATGSITLPSQIFAQDPPDAEGDQLPAGFAGQWLGPFQWPIEAVHAFVLPTGKVLQFSFPGPEFPVSILWEPGTEEFSVAEIDRPVGCSGHAFMPDGRLLVAGGGEGEGGIKDTHIFNPYTETWSRVQDMNHGRFYPSVLAMPDGRMLALAGANEFGEPNPEVAFYDPEHGWEVVSQQEFPLYPRVHLLDSGDVLYVGPTAESAIFVPSKAEWFPLPASHFGHRISGVSVLIPPTHDRSMIIGGVNPEEFPPLPTASVEVLELGHEPEPDPFWHYDQPMHFPRVDPNVVMLPNGRVLVVGGTSELHGDKGKGDGEVPGAVLIPEMFDPAEERWSVMNHMHLPRTEHATAILLPDARVLVGGGNGSHTVEIFYPPYLFHGPRPVIAEAPEMLAYGQPFEMFSPQASQIESVVLMRLSSATHWVNMDQRYVPIEFFHPPAKPGLLIAVPPESPAVAPPGFYMMFILNAEHTPSMARMIRIGEAADANGDADGDGDVDAADFAQFLECVTGPGGGTLFNCDPFDFQADLDVDFADFAAMQTAFTGP